MNGQNNAGTRLIYLWFSEEFWIYIAYRMTSAMGVEEVFVM